MPLDLMIVFKPERRNFVSLSKRLKVRFRPTENSVRSGLILNNPLVPSLLRKWSRIVRQTEISRFCHHPNPNPSAGHSTCTCISNEHQCTWMCTHGRSSSGVPSTCTRNRQQPFTHGTQSKFKLDMHVQTDIHLVCRYYVAQSETMYLQNNGYHNRLHSRAQSHPLKTARTPDCFLQVRK